jgi:ABC-type Fe3+ transport system permease subunit
VVGFFVIPVVGLFVGFVAGVYLAELRRVGSPRAWPSTVHSLKAVGWSIVIELVFALLATWTWVAGVVLT